MAKICRSGNGGRLENRPLKTADGGSIEIPPKSTKAVTSKKPAYNRYRTERESFSAGWTSTRAIRIAPAGEQWRPEKSFGQRVRRLTRADPQAVGIYGTISPPVFYISPPAPFPVYDNPGKLLDDVTRGKIRWVLTNNRDASTFAKDLKIVTSEDEFPFESAQKLSTKQVLLAPTGASD